jgi:hypothetical protein
MSRLVSTTLLAACLSAGPLTAQAPSRWSWSLGLEGLRFGAGAQDTVAESGSAVALRPSGRIGARLGVHRALGSWTAGLTIGVAQGNVEAANEVVAIRDRTADLSRYRAGVAVERRLARPRQGHLSFGVEPSLDLWSLDGETRTRAGLQAGLTLRLPLGTLELEQRIIVGVSRSPLEAADLGGAFERRSLRMLGFGVGVRAPL